jgi:hypothetical protein
MIETVKAFTALSEEFVELFMKHHPVGATEAGIHDYDTVLPDDSPDGLRERASWLRDLEGRLLASVPWDELPLESRVDFALLRSRISTLRADLEEVHVVSRTPTVPLMRAFQGVHLLLARGFAPLDERKEAAVARLMAVPDYLEGASSSLSAVPPELLEAGIELAARGPGFVDDVVRRLLRQFPGESERLEHAGSRARTGFLQFHDQLEARRSDEAGARASFALTERWLHHRYEREHLFSITATEVDEIAREFADKAREELAEEARRIDSKRDWRELLEEARTRVPEAGWLQETYNAEVERARRFVTDHGIVILPASERLELQDTPLYARDFSPQAGYIGPAPFDAEASGVLMLTPVDPRRDKDAQARQLAAHCMPSIPLMIARECYPGEHVLTTYASQAPTRLRRMVRNAAMSGGWSAWAEAVMTDEGFFDAEPWARLFGRLSALRLACNARTDVGLHTGRMTPAQAVDLMRSEAHAGEEEAVALVREVCLAPAKASSAFIGRMAVGDLHDEALRQLGSRFDRATFHAALGAGGILPPALVREEISGRLGLT